MEVIDSFGITQAEVYEGVVAGIVSRHWAQHSRLFVCSSPYRHGGTQTIIVLPCISGLEPDLAKLTKVGLVSGFLLQVAPSQTKAIRGCAFFNAVAIQTVNRAGRNVKTLKLHAGVDCTR